jgi:hypothetical protein
MANDCPFDVLLASLLSPVGAAAGETDDQVHRPRRIGLRSRHARRDRKRGSTRYQMKKLPAGIHGGPISAGSVRFSAREFDHL